MKRPGKILLSAGNLYLIATASLLTSYFCHSVYLQTVQRKLDVVNQTQADQGETNMQPLCLLPPA